MSVEDISRIRDLLQRRKSEAPAEMSKAERKRVVKEVRQKAEDLHSCLGMLHEVLTEGFKNHLPLGEDPEQINWELMPRMIANCFRPEFDFQPEDITAFYISVRDDSTTGNRQVGLRLDRENRWWSCLDLGTIVRKDYSGGLSHIHCLAPIGQKREAREAMKELDSSLWGEESKDTRGRMLKRDVRELGLLEEFLGFVVGEMERQIEQPLA